jgi:hypothetical protein
MLERAERKVKMTQEHSWSEFTTEQLMQRRSDLQKAVQSDPEGEVRLAMFLSEIEAELESRKQQS